MACNITAARGIDCRDAIGGLKAIYICSSYCSDILKEATVTASSYTITTAGFANWDIVDSGSVTVFKYDLVTDLSNFTTANRGRQSNRIGYVQSDFERSAT